MEFSDIAQWITMALAMSAAIGGLIGYLIKQNTKIAINENELKQLRDLVTKNAETVQELAVSMSGISEKLQLLLELR